MSELVVTEPAKRTVSTSKDGKWRSFPRSPNLLQYVSTGTYYARIKVRGKLIRQSLKTNVWSIARLRLADFVGEKSRNRASSSIVTVADAVVLYRNLLASDIEIKPQSKQYREWCLKKLLNTWPELAGRDVSQITEEECRPWAARLHETVACHYYNNITGTLKQVMKLAIKEHVKKGGTVFENPAGCIGRASIKPNELRLPEPSQFRALLRSIVEVAPQAGERIATVVQFLAYSGVRAFSEANWIGWDDVDWKRKEIIVRGVPATGTKNGEIRRIPLLPDMEKLLLELKAISQTPGSIVHVPRCDKILNKACAKAEVPRITLHDLRHLFATRCIESGVDIPTVSRWLGHRDGGALAMKTYGHLRNEHSQAMAGKVTF